MTTVDTRWRRPAWRTALVLALFALAPGTASADFLDPTTLHIGGVVPTLGGDPNQLGSSGLVNVYQNSTSAPTLDKPFLLILGIANDSTGATSLMARRFRP
jgi:hypothetical protein